MYQADYLAPTSLTLHSILYGVYTFFGWCAGTFLNYFGPSITVCIGGLGYPLYAGSLWAFGNGVDQAFPLFAGAFLGFSAALLWTGAGFIQFAYAEEKDKAKYITYQWSLSAVGGTIGSLIAFAANFHKTSVDGASAAVYIVFIIIMCIAIVGALLLLVKPKNVVRDDGRHIAVFKQPNIKTEIVGVWKVMSDPKIIILLPAMFAGEMILAPASSINGYFFNLRTRSLANLLFNFVMIPAPLLLAWVMDSPKIKSRRMRGVVGVTAIGTITMASLAGVLGWICVHDIDRHKTPPGADWTDGSAAVGYIFLYLFFGIVDACFQIVVQWTLSALTNDPVLCARYAGAFRGTVSLGMCIAFTLDARTVSYKNQIIIQLCVYALALCSLYYVILTYVKETNYFAEENVIVPVAFEEKAIVEGLVADDVIRRERELEKIARGLAVDDVESTEPRPRPRPSRSRGRARPSGEREEGRQDGDEGENSANWFSRDHQRPVQISSRYIYRDVPTQPRFPGIQIATTRAKR
ncbi:hypothetical protein CLAIMM_10089 isoform 2 [Cladophialophora immunda]|nr:hypothetical protein CLAIMM_10089 isoform 2 [Cladophialophora immunda]